VLLQSHGAMSWMRGPMTRTEIWSAREIDLDPEQQRAAGCNIGVRDAVRPVRWFPRAERLQREPVEPTRACGLSPAFASKHC
jgi:hypothetical protein